MASSESQQLRATFVKEPSGVPIARQRQQWEEAVRAVVLPPHSVVAPAVLAELAGEWVTCSAAPPSDAVLLWVHGGGFVSGSSRTHRELAARLAAASGMRVLTLDYRRAPEHSFPTPIEDVVTAYHWLLEQSHTPARLAIGGDSAGGALVLAALLMLRDTGVPLPAATVLISPWVDLSMSGPSMASRIALDPLASEGGLQEAAEHYLAGHDPHDPLASPLFANLHGLPPLLIQAGDHEILLSDATRLAERACAAGVRVQLDVWEEMWHVWHSWAAALPEGDAAITQIGVFLRQQLAAGDS